VKFIIKKDVQNQIIRDHFQYVENKHLEEKIILQFANFGVITKNL
jgi:hypothetical protein